MTPYGRALKWLYDHDRVYVGEPYVEPDNAAEWPFNENVITTLERHGHVDCVLDAGYQLYSTRKRFSTQNDCSGCELCDS